MNHSLRRADIETHVRIVAIALAAGIVIVIGALHAKLDTHAGVGDTQANGAHIKASQQIVYSRNERSFVR